METPTDSKPAGTAAPPPVPAAEAKPVEKAAESSSLLGTSAVDEKKEAPKAEEPKKTDETKKGEEPKAFTLKVPDGAKVPKEALEAFTKFAGEQKLSPEQAQAALDWQLAQTSALEKSADAELAKQDAAWLAEVKNDPEFGGKNFEATQKHIRRGVAVIGVDAAKVLDQAGLGNHPALVRAIARLGKANAEDSVASTTQAAGSSAEPGWNDLMYPTMKNKDR